MIELPIICSNICHEKSNRICSNLFPPKETPNTNAVKYIKKPVKIPIEICLKNLLDSGLYTEITKDNAKEMNIYNMKSNPIKIFWSYCKVLKSFKSIPCHK